MCSTFLGESRSVKGQNDEEMKDGTKERKKREETQGGREETREGRRMEEKEQRWLEEQDSCYEMKKKGGWGRREVQMKHSREGSGSREERLKGWKEGWIEKKEGNKDTIQRGQGSCNAWNHSSIQLHVNAKYTFKKNNKVYTNFRHILYKCRSGLFTFASLPDVRCNRAPAGKPDNTSRHQTKREVILSTFNVAFGIPQASVLKGLLINSKWNQNLRLIQLTPRKAKPPWMAAAHSKLSRCVMTPPMVGP